MEWRPSIPEDSENPLNVHVGLIVCAAVEATDFLLGAIHRTLAGEIGNNEESAWSADDIDEVSSYLSRKCAFARPEGSD
jgi:hypothetical protein